MVTEFKIAYDKLYWLLYDFTPDDEPWFFPAVGKLIEKYGEQVAIAFAQKEAWPEYTFELLVKSGFRNIPKHILLPYLHTRNDDNIYCTAFCLAACGYQDVFDILLEFANQTHPLSKNRDPKIEILPDLEFIEDKRIHSIKKLCQHYP